MVKAQDWVRRNLQGDPYIWAIVFVLSLISLLVVYSAVSAPAFKYQDGNTEHYLFRHALMLGIAISAMWVAHRINYAYYLRITRLLLWVSVPLLVYTYFAGEEINGAVRWIRIMGISFQPSDVAKLALVSSIAGMLAKRQHQIEDFKTSVFPVLLWIGVICGIISLSDFSTAFMIFITCLLVMFIGRVPLKYLFGLIGIGIVFIGVGLAVGDRGITFATRIADFIAILTGSVGESEIPYQVQRANMAIAHGGFMGVGAGQGHERYFLPAGISDYIYAILIEEHGMKLGIIVIFLYLGLLWRGMKTVANSERAFGGLLSAGLSFSLVIQAFINIAVVVGLGPVTGLPLPFISMGGTSLLFTGISFGIILSVSRGGGDEKTALQKQYGNQIVNAQALG